MRIRGESSRPRLGRNPPRMAQDELVPAPCHPEDQLSAPGLPFSFAASPQNQGWGGRGATYFSNGPGIPFRHAGVGAAPAGMEGNLLRVAEARLDRDELVPAPGQPEEQRPGLPDKETRDRQGRPHTLCSKAGVCPGARGAPGYGRGACRKVVTDKAAPKPNARRRVFVQEQENLLAMAEGLAAGSLSTMPTRRRVYVDFQPRQHWGGILEARRVTRRVFVDLQEPAIELADPAIELAESQARQVMGDGLLRVAERTERRMEPSDEGEGM